MSRIAGLQPGPVLSLGEAMLELSPRGDDQWRMGIAGDTLNTAWYLRAALPAVWSVGYLTRLGSDAFSDRIADFIAGAGIDTSAISRDPQRGCGLYAISLMNGERSFTYWRGQSAARHLADDRDRLAQALAPARVIYLSGITLAILTDQGRENLLDLLRARPKHVVLAFDPNIRPRLWPDAETMRQTLTAVAALSDLVLPSFDDESAHFGDTSPEDTLHRYLDHGATEVVVKNAGGPILAASGAVLFRHDPASVTPLDTTGAGDSFNGGYLTARLQGQGVDRALRCGADLAARVIRHPGALIPMDQLTASRV